MNRPGLPVLITSAIHIAANRTSLQDPALRLEKTLASLEQWRRTPGVSAVVVCDGSGVDLSPHVAAADADSGTAPCECLFFFNDQAMVRARGKGHGEGEIVKHALEHSPTLRDSRRFAKCTSKLWVSNFQRCVARARPGVSFDYGGVFRPVHLDTRFYLADTGFFRQHLLDAYQAVDEDRGHYLEHAYRDALGGFRLSEIAMFPTPKITGTSGSMNHDYQPRPGKDLLRDARSLLVRALGL